MKHVRICSLPGGTHFIVTTAHDFVVGPRLQKGDRPHPPCGLFHDLKSAKIAAEAWENFLENQERENESARKARKH
jgi:hypothetical protein